MFVTLEDAHAVAKKLKDGSAKILSVELFGSVLKNGQGHDLDFMLLVDDELAQKFWAQKDDTRVKWPTSLFFIRRLNKRLFPALDEAFISKRKNTRIIRAQELVGLDFALLGEQHRPGTKIDAWLVPQDWRQGNKLNLSAMTRIADISGDKKTLMLLKCVAEDSVKIA